MEKRSVTDGCRDFVYVCTYVDMHAAYVSFRCIQMLPTCAYDAAELRRSAEKAFAAYVLSVWSPLSSRKVSGINRGTSASVVDPLTVVYKS